ncbi:MAG: ferredoxin--NADP reductase [Bacteroidales bacterium]|nr:ferredoxin--NADP reductase [Bacteroidales bacterium]
MNELNCFVTQVLQVSPIMKIIRLKPDGWELPEYKPGQFIALGLYASAPRCAEATEEHTQFESDKLIKRAYSIASSSTQEFIEFYITLVHSGSLTPRIFNLKIGDKIWVGKKATGMFTIDEIEPDQNVILIGTGTGVAPYMSMLRSNALSRQGQIMVIHGAANSWDLGYSSELALLQSMFPKFHYHPTITEPAKEPVGWNGDIRFIEEIWKDTIIDQKFGFRPTPDNTHIFLCGNPIMINGMKELLAAENFMVHKKKEPGQIHIEEF